MEGKPTDPKIMANPGYHKTIFLAKQDYAPAVNPLEVVAKWSLTKRKADSRSTGEPAHKKGSYTSFDASKHTMAPPPAMPAGAELD